MDGTDVVTRPCVFANLAALDVVVVILCGCSHCATEKTSAADANLTIFILLLMNNGPSIFISLESTFHLVVF
jgi:hypothetical protein